MPWSTRFDDPIAIPKQRPLRTLAEARGYILSLSSTEKSSIAWRTALGLLEQAAKLGSPYTSMAHLAFTRALNNTSLLSAR